MQSNTIKNRDLQIAIAVFLAGLSCFGLLYYYQALLPDLVEYFKINKAKSSFAVSSATLGMALGLITLKNLYRGDCGSTHYYKWKVRPGTEGTSTESPRKPDLDLIQGKFYLDEETNTLKAIKKTDTHLIGKTIKLRSPISGCNHTNHYGICEVCYGQLSDNIPPNTNLGQANGTMVCEKSSQGVMSVKHYDGSSKVEPIIIAQED
jgi:hypothetical protein